MVILPACSVSVAWAIWMLRGEGKELLELVQMKRLRPLPELPRLLSLSHPHSHNCSPDSHCARLLSLLIWAYDDDRKASCRLKHAYFKFTASKPGHQKCIPNPC